jgi:Protein of unknown function (DUF3592)
MEKRKSPKLAIGGFSLLCKGSTRRFFMRLIEYAATMEKIAAGVFSLLLGSVGLWTGLRQLKNRLLLNSWKTTPGKVIERGTYRPKIASLSASAFRYSPLVKYSYQVNGADFINDAIHPRRIQLPRHSSKKWAQKQAEKFPGEVLVHYNSDDPGESYLIMTSKLVLGIVVALGVLLILIGLVVLLI